MDLKLTTVDLAQIVAEKGYLTVEMEGVDKAQLLENVTLEDVFDHFGDEAVEFAKDNYNLTEAE